MQIEEALTIIDQLDPIKEKEEIDIKEGLGRVLAEDLTSPIDLPLFSKSPLDGYAFDGQASQEGTRLRVIGQVMAGDPASIKVKRGQAVRIMTGARMPEGTNTVARLETVRNDKDHIILDQTYQPYSNYIYQGEEIKKGQRVFSQGEELNAIKLGTLANLGLGQVQVYRPARLAVVSTGSELISYHEPVQEDKIFNSNGLTLALKLQELGLEADQVSQVPDQLDLLVDSFSLLSQDMDLVISTGGVSVGDHDYMEEVMARMEAKKVFAKVKMKPGGHILCYQKDKTTFLALSGNPFAALSTFEIFGRAILTRLTGRDLALKVRTGILTSPFPKKSRGRRLIRAHYDQGQVSLPQAHESGQIASAASCNALVDIPAGSPALEVGDQVRVLLL